MPDAFYHLHTRGNDRRRIYFGNWSGRLFVRELERASRRHGWRVLAYCLMPNHYHAVLQIYERLSAGMRELNGRIARTSNRTLNRTDHLFGDRFTSHLVPDESYLLEVVRYTLLNPVRAGLIERPEAWRWSSMAATLGRGHPPACLDAGWLLGRFAGSPETARVSFREFVADGIGRPVPVPSTDRVLVVAGATRGSRPGSRLASAP